LPSAWRLGTRQRKFSKKKIKALCRVPSGLALGKEFFKKKALPSAWRFGTRQRKFSKKKIEALCRVPHVLALGKESFKKNLKKSLPSAGRVDTRQSDRQRNRRRDGRFSLPSVSGALGKAFAECPIKYTRQRVLCRSIFCRVCFAECHTRQRLCRVQYSLCRVPQALGEEPESSSE